MYSLTEAEKQYDRIVGLRSTSCSIPTDRLVVVMGASGSGKSTLLRLLSFVELPERGTVRLELNGDTFDNIGRSRPWPRLTCVFQKQFLWPHLTLRENLRLPLRTVRDFEATQRIASVVELFAMSEFVDRYPNEVSGGQAQRAALARALVLDPELILIDEAHTGLDLEQQAILNSHLLKLKASSVGLIIVSHSLSFARRHADTVVTLKQGLVTAVDTREVFLRTTAGYAKDDVDSALDSHDITVTR